MDSSFFDGVFSGAAHLPEPAGTEAFALYNGPLPADRDPAFWTLYEKDWYQYVSEKDVFNVLLRHSDDAGKKNWEIGIGAGGQLYSWRGPWGEAIPPQAAPWMDEVWQATMHCPDVQRLLEAIYEHDPAQSNATNSVGQGFVHGSGCSNKYGAASDEPYEMFFCPKLASWYDDTDHSYAIINWGQSSTQPTIFPHKILYYSRYRYLGDGVLEVSNVIYNFGDFEYGYNGTPWGGVRHSTYPNIFWSNIDGSYTFNNSHRQFGGGSYLTVDQTDGWLGAAAAKDDPNSQAFGFAHGTRVASVCVGTAGAGGARDYIVMASNPGLGGDSNLAKGESFWNRYYLMVGTFADVSRNAAKYAAKAGWGDLNQPEQDATSQALYRTVLADGTVSLTREVQIQAQPACRVYNEPVRHAVPLFVISEQPTGRTLVSTDPYALSRTEPYANPLPAEHESHADLDGAIKRYTYESDARKKLDWDLLGFVMPAAHISADRAGYVDLASIVDTPGNRGMLALAPGAFSYSDLVVTQQVDLRFTVQAAVQNLGPTAALAIVKLYLADRKLLESRQLQLAAGERQTVAFAVTAEQLSVVNAEGDRVVEPGTFTVILGPSSQDILLQSELQVAKRTVVRRRPQFQVSPLKMPAKVAANKTFSVRATVTNTGERAGTTKVAFLVDGEPTETKRIQVQPGKTETVEFRTHRFEIGDHTVQVGDQAASVQITARPPTFAFRELEADAFGYAGQAVRASATITNLGSTTGTVAATLQIDGTVVATKDIRVPAGLGGATAVVRFSHRFAKSGEYKLTIGDLAPATVLIGEPIKAPNLAFTNTKAGMFQADDRFIIRANQSDTWKHRDAYGAIFREQVTGDFEAVVRVDSLELSNPDVKAGLMVRNDITKPGVSPGYVSILLSPKWRYMFLWDSDQNGSVDSIREVAQKELTFPIWLKLEKRGKRIFGSRSDDGTTWIQMASHKVLAAANTQDVGFFATSGDDDTPYWATFSNFDVSSSGEH